MSDKKPANPPAFPCERDEPEKGMTLRDYFAAKAMNSFLNNFYNFNEIAIKSYEIADAMLKARETENQ